MRVAATPWPRRGYFVAAAATRISHISRARLRALSARRVRVRTVACRQRMVDRSVLARVSFRRRARRCDCKDPIRSPTTRLGASRRPRDEQKLTRLTFSLVAPRRRRASAGFVAVTPRGRRGGVGRGGGVRRGRGGLGRAGLAFRRNRIPRTARAGPRRRREGPTDDPRRGHSAAATVSKPAGTAAASPARAPRTIRRGHSAAATCLEARGERNRIT